MSFLTLKFALENIHGIRIQALPNKDGYRPNLLSMSACQ